MNPTQVPGQPVPGGTPAPPRAPQNSAPITDIPEEAFGFADEPSAPPPQPRTTPAGRPIAPQPAAAPLPAPVVRSTVAAVPLPQPQPQLAPPVPRPPAPLPTMPADITPPTQTPAAPVLTPSQSLITPQPIAAAAPPPQSTNDPFDPAKVPVHASSTPENPITTTYTPSTPHLSSDLADRIAEKPMQNSNDILRQVRRGLDGSRLKSVLSFILFTAAIFVAAFLINQFVFQSYYVEGTSMTPTLQNDDRLIISKVERTLAAVQGKPYIPDRGQIVVLDSSIVGLNGQHEQLIKRVIGLPGDKIHIENGVVTITNTDHPNGYDITQDLGLTNLQATYSDSPIDLTVPVGSVYVIGDNREQGGSYDSRAFGPISGDKIQGRLWGRILPLDKAQLY